MKRHPRRPKSVVQVFIDVDKAGEDVFLAKCGTRTRRRAGLREAIQDVANRPIDECEYECVWLTQGRPGVSDRWIAKHYPSTTQAVGKGSPS